MIGKSDEWATRMIRFTSGDLLRSEADALVNAVNCVGAMGRGIALQFKKEFPRNFEEYKQACDRGEVVPGKMFITVRTAPDPPRFIVNFPTKRHWRGKSRIEDIQFGLVMLRDEIEARHITSIAIPPLGSGLGGLDWPDVRRLIVNELSGTTAEIIVYEPGEVSDARSAARTKKPPKMTAARAALVLLMNRYLRGLLDPFVTLVELHRLMYFMQAAGEPFRLEFKKHQFGPHAENLRHAMNAIEGHFISGCADGGDNPRKQIELVPGAVDDAEALLREHPDTKARLECVCNLIDGFESPFGMELLATVHWVMQDEGVTEEIQAIKSVHEWSERKRRFTTRQIGIAFDRLVDCGFGPSKSSAA